MWTQLDLRTRGALLAICLFSLPLAACLGQPTTISVPATATASPIIIASPTASQPTPTAQPTATPIQPTLTPVPSPTAMPSMQMYPSSARTGIKELDDIIAAVLAGDLETLRKLVRYTTTACTTAEGLGGPPKCERGEVQGTPVEVFPFLGSEGSYVRRATIDNVLQFKVKGLYAVYRVRENAYQEVYWPAGKYAIVFILDDDLALTLLSDRGGIVRIVFHLGQTPARVIEQDAGKLLLPPIFLQ